MKAIIKYSIVILIILLAGFIMYIFWPMKYNPQPANCDCLPMDNDTGKLVPIKLDVNNIHAIALTYPEIIYQSGSDYNPNAQPLIFRKLYQSVNKSNVVEYPSQKNILDKIDKIEAGLSKILKNEFKEVPVLMDYEVEIGIILLEDITQEQLSDPSFSPKLGYFLANDLQLLSFAILGFGTELQSKYYDEKGSFSGFMPISEKMWIPREHKPNSTLCMEIKTTINNEVRQKDNTKNRIYTNREILNFMMKKYNKKILTKGTAIITGSPAGVAFKTSRWKKRLANLLKLKRIQKLSSIYNTSKIDNKFLKPGDSIIIEGGSFFKVETKIINPQL